MNIRLSLRQREADILGARRRLMLMHKVTNTPYTIYIIEGNRAVLYRTVFGPSDTYNRVNSRTCFNYTLRWLSPIDAKKIIKEYRANNTKEVLNIIKTIFPEPAQ